MRVLVSSSIVLFTGCALVLGAKDVPVPKDGGSEAASPDGSNLDGGGEGAVIEISGGRGHTCVLREGGSVWCWGFNQYGQLGVAPNNAETCTVETGNMNPKQVTCVPRPIRAEIPFKVAHLGHPLGVDSTCVIDVDKKVWCFGRNGAGELGHATGDSMCFSPLFGANEPCNPVPKVVDGLPPVTQVAAGGPGVASTVCALTTAGGVYCWGSNTYGQLGAVRPSSSMPGPVSGADLTIDVTGIALGFGVQACATKGASVWCWGGNYKGSLGHSGSTDSPCTPYTCSTTPQQVMIGAMTALDAASIHVGGNVSCGRRFTGEIYCWGNNQYAGLGQGDWDDADHTLATLVLKSSTFLEVGGHGLCALVKNASTTLSCWGNNTLGAIGIETLGSVVDGGSCGGYACVATPQPASLPTTVPVLRMGTGFFHAVAQLTDGSLWGWGGNGYGQLAHTPGSLPTDLTCNNVEKCSPTPVRITLP